MDTEERPSKLQKISHATSKDVSLQKIDDYQISAQNLGEAGIEASVDDRGTKVDCILDPIDNGANKEIDTSTLDAEIQSDSVKQDSQTPIESKPLSKNQQKKLLKKQRWEENRSNRKIRRKEKIVQKREQKRAAKAAETSNPDSSLADADRKAQNHDLQKQRAVQLPVTIVIDCGFDELMNDNERISLGSQITRSYSDNKNARLQAHLMICSWGGLLRERFDNLLQKHHESWRGVRWIEGDFVEASEQAKEFMAGERGGKPDGALLKAEDGETSIDALKEQGEVVYLSSESENTLHELKPYSTYIIGGLVDKNRHKGICYKRAMDRKIKTARLPIGDYMSMNSRKVLTTNHVSEMIIRWLESGDWGSAFTQVMPKRKGGQLKVKATSKEAQPEDHKSDDEDQMRKASGSESASNNGGDDAIDIVGTDASSLRGEEGLSSASNRDLR
ncbi:MAG: tRNA (guanine(9)-N(1))-methyltransferase [Bathelium mastoideum]|nr:MAG: tRNA (guanine(9)-N(1))-methyltransferase [Bathelium mastoideum]KAI9691200.1 MAG: tRNA (guanine(9)-N(1))-methyltransferase [Bathelium mastoideum]